MTKSDEFEELRPMLFAIAYRVLGSVTEAEDAVQESWLRYEASPTQPTSPKAYLSAVVTRISIDVLRSARVRRETYVGEWFPEPLLDDPYEDPQRSAELADSVSMAAILLIERLTPLERAVFVLRGVFAFPDPEVAVLQGVDVDALRELLAADVQMVGDGGGKAPAFARAVVGADNVARVLATAFPAMAAMEATVQQHDVNGQPGAVLRDSSDRVVGTMSLDVLDGRIQTIRSVANPDKLGHLGPVADAWAMTRAMKDSRRTRD